MKRKKFFLLGPHKIKIKYVKDLKNSDGQTLYGLADFGSNTIFVCTQFGEDKLDEDVIEHTQNHEIFHCILNYLNYHELNNNDVFVDTVAGCFLQVIKSLK